MYEQEYQEFILNSPLYFAKHARETLTWDKQFTKTYNGNQSSPEWFYDGMLNACYNVIDRHVETTPEKLAIIFDDNDGNCHKYTYKECQTEIIKVANFLNYATQNNGLTQYIAIYMHTSPQLIFTALACARLGLPHNIIFGGFSAESIALRIKDSDAKIIFTDYKVMREDKTIMFFENVINAQKILNDDGYQLDYIVVYDSDQITEYEDDPKLIFWNEVLKCANSQDYKTKQDIEKENMPIYQPTQKISTTHLRNQHLISTLFDINKFVPCTPVNAENQLFCLYTSGSTGKPKGIVHTTAGYLFYAAFTTKKAYAVTKDSVFFSSADIGWIAGHTHSLYGSMTLGCTIVIMAGSPIHPNVNRVFRVIDEHKITHFFTAPTVIRMLRQKLGDLKVGFKNRSLMDVYLNNDINSDQCDRTKYINEKINFNVSEKLIIKGTENIKPDLPFEKFINQQMLSTKAMMEFNPNSFYRANTSFHANDYDLSSLKTIIYAGETLNKEAYVWCKNTFGPFIPLLGAYWQTESGSNLLSGHIYQTYPIHESTGVPFYGLKMVLSNEQYNKGTILISESWPGVARGIINDRKRYLTSYFNVFEGFFYTGDVAYMKRGIYYVQGRNDDIVKVAGHRLSTTEIENACCSVDSIIEAAAIGIYDKINGQVINIFCVKKDSEIFIPSKTIINAVRHKIGPVVRISDIYFVPELPKTRAGKIMRRVLKSIIEGNSIGDLSTCLNIEVISKIYKTYLVRAKKMLVNNDWISI